MTDSEVGKPWTRAIEIRAEIPEDLAAVHALNVAAFGRSGEAELVDRLRGGAHVLSLVAVKAGQTVGHICFSPVTIGEALEGPRFLGLAPVAVLPSHQHQGIGSLLIRRGLADAARSGSTAIVVLGAPAFYARFGFVPAKTKGLKCEYAVPEEAFMVLELVQDALADQAGTVKYRSEFNQLA